ncbi:hypothetical protein EON63_16220, partial [archaeon]
MHGYVFVCIDMDMNSFIYFTRFSLRLAKKSRDLKKREGKEERGLSLPLSPPLSLPMTLPP